MDRYNNKVNFFLPGLFEHYKLYEKLLTVLKQHPEYLKDNVNIGAVYGSPYCIWNAGRNNYTLFPLTELIVIRDFMDSMHIPVRFTFTNLNLNMTHIFDHIGNQLLALFNTGNNEVTIASEVLENHIRKAYGDRYAFISSTTKVIKDPEEQTKELNKDYKYTVIDYDFNKNWDYLSSITHKEKCEILINSVCRPHCKERLNHYKYISSCQLNEVTEVHDSCPLEKRTLSQCLENHEKLNFIRVEDLNKYVDAGFTNFKIEGRNYDDYRLIETLNYYLIKDEYKLKVSELLRY